VAEAHSDIPECTIHVDIYYTLLVLITAALLKTSLRAQNIYMQKTAKIKMKFSLAKVQFLS